MREQTQEAHPPASGSPLVTNEAPSQKKQNSREDEGTSSVSHPASGPKTRQPSMVLNLLVTGVVALICGALGAMGYLQFLGAKASASPASPFQGGSKDSPSSNTQAGGALGTESARDSSTQPPSSSSVSGAVSSHEADALKEQITNLTRHVDRLGEEVERVEHLLSLAVPLLQRMAPKH